jgi:hypothetical protein
MLERRNTVRKPEATWRANVRRAKGIWGPIKPIVLDALKQITKALLISVADGDVQLLNNMWYVTHAGLLRIAKRRRCSGIDTVIEERLSDPNSNRWVFKATVFTSSNCKGFTGYGDADPSNVSSLVHGAELRIAETRAVNRALRKAYGIGICSVEELGSSGVSNRDPDPYKWASAPAKHSNNGQPRLRDQLCVLIRQHNLDPALVKAYAADFCGTATLSGASRDLVESFISHLSSIAKENRDSLVCKLNSYTQSAGARP